MKYLCGLILTLVTSSYLFADDSEEVRKELKALQGKWKAVALEADGKALPKEGVPDFLFIVGADGKATGQMGKTEYQSKVTVDPKKKPKTIDNAHETGQHKGKKQFGVYKIENGKWMVCMTAPGATGGDRPKNFETKDTKYVLFTFERVKEDQGK